MFFYSTVTVPAVVHTSQMPVHFQQDRQYQHSWQRNFMQSMFGMKQQEPVAQPTRVISSPRPLRRQIQPTYRVSLRRRITDTLNSPFEYEMSEAARVVL